MPTTFRRAKLPTVSQLPFSLAAGVLLVVPLLLLFLADELGANTLPLLLIGVLCSFPAWLRRDRAVDLLEPVWLYCLLYFLEFFVKPVATLNSPEAFGTNFFAVDYASASVTWSLILAALGLAFFFLGYYSRITVRLAHALPDLPPLFEPSRRLIVFSASLGLFAFLIHFFAARGGFSLEYMYQNRTQVNANVGDLAQLLHFASWLPLAMAFSKAYSTAPAGLAPKVLLVITVMGVAAGMSIFGSRGSMLFGGVSLAVAYHYRVRRMNLKSASLALALLFTVSALFGAFRGRRSLEDVTLARLGANLADEIRGYQNWDIFLGICQYYPAQRPYYHGSLAAESVFWLIPRRFWQTKPLVYGSSLIQDDIAPNLRLGVDTGGFTGTFISQSTLGEGYADFGAPGSLLYMFLFGVVWGSLYQYMRRQDYALPVVAIYGVIYTGLPMYIRGFSSPILLMLLWLIPSIIIFRWMAPSRWWNERRSLHE